MAWTESCKFDFRRHVEHLINREGISARQAIIRVAEENEDIPVSTMERWFYVEEEDHTKNDVIEAPKEKKAPWPTCSNPNCIYKLPVKRNRNREPQSNGLCKGCHQKAIQQKKEDDYKKEIEEARAAFDAEPINQEAEAIWAEIVDDFERILNKCLCDVKISEKTSKNIADQWMILGKILYELKEKSTRPREFT